MSSQAVRSTPWPIGLGFACILVGGWIYAAPRISRVFSTAPSGQRAAVDSLVERAAVSVSYNDAGGVVALAANTPAMDDEAAAYLVQLESLRTLRLERSGITADALQSIGKLKQLDSLFLDQTLISDAGLVHLKEIRGLSTLSVAQCKLTDKGVATVGKLHSLTSLNLSGTGVSDQGLQHLQGLEELDKLYLQGTKISGTGFAHIGEATGLTVLDLSGAPIDRDAIQSLRNLFHLEQLYMKGCPVDDQMIGSLMEVLTASTPNLKLLSLPNTPLGDGAVEHLKDLVKLKKLAVVQLQDTRISKAAFQDLARCVPDVNFSVNYSESDD